MQQQHNNLTAFQINPREPNVLCIKCTFLIDKTLAVFNVLVKHAHVSGLIFKEHVEKARCFVNKWANVDCEDFTEQLNPHHLNPTALDSQSGAR